MDTITDYDNTARQAMLKAAAPSLKGILGPATMIPKNLLMAYIAAAAAIGAAGGAGLGAASSYVKSKDPKLTALARKKKYYDGKLKEMENENWLNDVMAAKKKLETSRLTDEERTALEDKYIKMLGK